MSARLTAIYRSARSDPELCVLEGLHAIKHALRFGAEIQDMRANSAFGWRTLVLELSADILSSLKDLVVEIPDNAFADLAPQPPHTGLIALARRPQFDPISFWQMQREGPVVILENPSHPGNTGAVIRTAAAAGASAVLCTGLADPWHPTTIRAAAGLHFALVVGRLDDKHLPDLPLTGLDADGSPMPPSCLDRRDILIFGSERRGLSEAMKGRLSRRLALPMRAGVSSLNLAASVAVMLYHWRLTDGAGQTDN